MTDLAQSTRLPMDVIYDIIGQLATPHNQDAFVHEPDVVAALCSLCLVRRDVHRWSVRQLYSRISITSDSQLTLLLATGMPHRSFIRSLHLEGFGAKLDSESIARLLLIVGRVVERLMVDIMDVVVLIYLLETSPGRQGTLSLRSPDGPWVHVDDFGGMPALQEVVFSAISDARISFPEPCPTLSERWPNLRRLAFYGDFYNTTNLFKGLEVLIFTWDSDTSIEMVHQIIENHPALQRLVFLIPNVWAWWYAHKISTSEKRAIAEAHLGRLSILEIYHPHKEEIAKRSGANHSWFAEHCRGGTLWELSGQEWLSLE